MGWFQDERVDSRGGITVEHGPSRSLFGIPSSLQSKAGFLITLGKKGREAGSRYGVESENICVSLQAAGSTQEPSFFFFLF